MILTPEPVRLGRRRFSCTTGVVWLYSASTPSSTENPGDGAPTANSAVGKPKFSFSRWNRREATSASSYQDFVGDYAGRGPWNGLAFRPDTGARPTARDCGPACGERTAVEGPGGI